MLIKKETEIRILEKMASTISTETKYVETGVRAEISTGCPFS